MDHEALTAWGASSVDGSLSGSSTHWNAWWIAEIVEAPASLKTRAAIQRAPGAVPIEEPLASPPTMRPVTPVPCPVLSYGVACWP